MRFTLTWLFSLLQFPQHKPVIIPLGDDSDDSLSEPEADDQMGENAVAQMVENPTVLPAASSNLMGNIDMFLSSVRHDVETKVILDVYDIATLIAYIWW